jgi:hypothetical protein
MNAGNTLRESSCTAPINRELQPTLVGGFLAGCPSIAHGMPEHLQGSWLRTLRRCRVQKPPGKVEVRGQDIRQGPYLDPPAGKNYVAHAMAHYFDDVYEGRGCDAARNYIAWLSILES